MNKTLLRELIILTIGYVIISIIILTSGTDLRFKLIGVFGIYTYFLFILLMISTPLKEVSTSKEERKQGD